MDEQLASFLRDFSKLTTLASMASEITGGTPLLPTIEAHLGTEPGRLPVVVEPFPSHRLADASGILAGLIEADPGARIHGLAGQQRHHMDLSDLVASNGMHAGWLGEPDYETISVGPDEERRIVSFGLFLFTHAGNPLAVLMRQANPQYGRERATVEVLGASPDAVDDFLKHFKTSLRENSIFRGHVISFTANDYSSSAAGITFHRRANVAAGDVVLPPGTLERIEAQVLGVGEHREKLLAHGAHLKRGVLLYGPPGTGKTHTVRYLASAAAGHTVILLSGNTLAFVSEAARMARALQPAIVVLEDCDLVAEDRSFGHGPQPLLFEVLDAMDGLDTDADVAFLLTTNRVELLEEALVQRPGRVDLAVAVPRPDVAARRALLELYGRRLNPSAQTIESIAEQIDGTTASFAKELTRRAILLAALAGEEPGDAHLSAAATELMSDAASLTRSLLGGTGESDAEQEQESTHGHFGFEPGIAPEVPGSMGWS
ncbi:AAA family ATPase [Paeniglutamicibacter psychrophenolicus]|uniref:DNA polymerase III delta prime subunit n=1 Tax=Paeniglutamicibacter psychrophenolicus TaxID=257454 RepID=A0ABS4WDV0_9MICC|nr:ATP-binding protein [Paeniglutamicibacter psychrophenolicus]MBP2374386.1 DNA polymerase III delta prime subunit [Paeniglutamicibacter psychrophenolicus]